MAAAEPLAAVRLPSGRVGRAALPAAIAWREPGRAVVWKSLVSGRNWMVLSASRAHRAPEVHRECAGNVSGACVSGVLLEGAVSAKLLSHLVRM
jgi:hypothetical protein